MQKLKPSVFSLLRTRFLVIRDHAKREFLLPLVELSTASLESVHVTMPCEAVVGISTFSSVLAVVVELCGLDVVSSPVINDEVALVDVLAGSVTGFLLDVAVVLGRLVVLRVTDVDLTVVVVFVGFDEVV